MTWPVCNKLNKTLMRSVFGIRQTIIEDSTEHLHQLKVRRLIVAANIVCLPNFPFSQNQPERLAMVFHIEPIPNLRPVAVDWQRLALQRLQDHERAFKIMSGISFSGN